MKIIVLYDELCQLANEKHCTLCALTPGGLSAVKAQTTHRMKSDTFNGIFKLGSGLKKKKKKGRKKVGGKNWGTPV